MLDTRGPHLAAGGRTVLLLGGLTGLLVLVGALIGGGPTALAFLGFAAVLNLGACWFSDRLVLRMSGAQPLDEAEVPRLYGIVRELCMRSSLPLPRVYLIPRDQPNAFATGRGPGRSAVAVTRGLLRLLPEHELRAVIAHELAHIRNRDVLIQSVAATIGGAITYLAYMLLWFGRGSRNSPLQAAGALALALLAPLAATVIRLAVSRQREYAADAAGAVIADNPESLAAALERLEAGATAAPMEVNAAAEPLYIVRPLKGGVAGMFSTHPPIEERARRLRAMRREAVETRVVEALGYR